MANMPIGELGLWAYEDRSDNRQTKVKRRAKACKIPSSERCLQLLLNEADLAAAREMHADAKAACRVR